VNSPTITALPRVRGGWRVFFFYTCAFALTGFVSLLFADLIWRTGWSLAGTFLLLLFIILFLLAAIGCVHGVFGFVLQLTGDSRRITNLADYKQRDISQTSTAIVFPVYNEDSARVCEGLRATYESIARTGQLDRFDFFILSDSTNPDRWVAEERRWFDLVKDLNALGNIFYRRRISNDGKKSGNIRDFLSTWGKRYRYCIVFDADSIMRGETVVDLVRLMEAHPNVGLIQTVPALVNAGSLFGRIQQFSNRLYARIFISGLNYWAHSFGNYWGHNAIFRTEPFMQCCDLPHLPGRKPFGGQILSHDFVEAALLLKENWQVWLAYDLEGSYEEAPQAMIENAQRDRRWCQGNLQHAMVVFARGLRGLSRIHLAMGIFGYLSSPLWLAFLLTFNWMLYAKRESGLSEIPVRAFTPILGFMSVTEHAFLIFGICMTVLFLPKVLALVDLSYDSVRRRQFGGLHAATVSAVLETAFSALHAPLQMLWHSKFVATILMGMGVNWGAQNRTADGTAWSSAIQAHAGHTLIGLGWGWCIWRLDRATFWWFAPVMLGMLVSIPLSVFTSRMSLGQLTRKAGLFLTPEETEPSQELVVLRTRVAAHDANPVDFWPHWGLAHAAADPCVNAIHVSLLREKELNPIYAEALAQVRGGGLQARVLAERLLTEGPDALKPVERMFVMIDSETMAWLHREVWVRPPAKLAVWWQGAIQRVAR